MAFITAFGEPGVRLPKPSINLVFVCVLLQLSMSVPSSSAAQIVSLSSSENNEIDGSGIINTPHHNTSSALRSIPFVGNTDTPLPIGRLCEYDSDCGNFSICRLVVSDLETTKKICECDTKEMKLVNNTCYIKPGHQCYFPTKNSHGYSFIPCFRGSACKVLVNKTAPQNGYCMCKGSRDKSRYLNENYEMARCSASLMYTGSAYYILLGYLGMRILSHSVHNILSYNNR